MEMVATNLWQTKVITARIFMMIVLLTISSSIKQISAKIWWWLEKDIGAECKQCKNTRIFRAKLRSRPLVLPCTSKSQDISLVSISRWRLLWRISGNQCQSPPANGTVYKRIQTRYPKTAKFISWRQRHPSKPYRTVFRIRGALQKNSP